MLVSAVSKTLRCIVREVYHDKLSLLLRTYTPNYNIKCMAVFSHIKINNFISSQKSNNIWLLLSSARYYMVNEDMPRIVCVLVFDDRNFGALHLTFLRTKTENYLSAYKMGIQNAFRVNRNSYLC